MRFAIITASGAGMSGGYKKYLKQIIPRMLKDTRIERIILYLPIGIEMQFDGEKIDIRHKRQWEMYFEKGNIEKELIKDKIETVFVPNIVPLKFKDIKTVNMIHNMEPMYDNIENNTKIEKTRNSIRRIMAKESCKRSNRIIAVSKYVKNYLVENWEVKKEKIDVIYHGADDIDDDIENESERVIPLNGIKLKDKFIFTGGSIRPARGIMDIVSVLDEIEKEINIGIAGSDYCKYRKWIEKKAGKNKERIVWLGTLKTAEMIWCYRNANAFIMTSRVEACPFIALEAMRNGCEIVSTYNEPMPEIFGDAAEYYEAGEGKELAKKIENILKRDRAEKERAKSNAIERSKRFKWEETKNRTIETLMK